MSDPIRAGGLLPSFSFAKAQFLALALLLTACGVVPFEDLSFALLASLYIYFIAKVVFPPVTPTRPPSVYAGSKLLRKYVSVGAFVGLLLPLCYMLLGGFVLGDKKAVQPAGPHTFLLACQVLTEQVASGSDAVSLAVRAFVPIFYNTRRLFSIWDWIRTDFGKGADEIELSSAIQWLYFGRILAVANAMFWSFNLFCFLLPVFLPRAFRQYYEAERMKMDLKN